MLSLPLCPSQSEQLHSYLLTLSFCLKFILKRTPMTFCLKTLVFTNVKEEEEEKNQWWSTLSQSPGGTQVSQLQVPLSLYHTTYHDIPREGTVWACEQRFSQSIPNTRLTKTVGLLSGHMTELWSGRGEESPRFRINIATLPEQLFNTKFYGDF